MFKVTEEEIKKLIAKESEGAKEQHGDKYKNAQELLGVLVSENFEVIENMHMYNYSVENVECMAADESPLIKEGLEDLERACIHLIQELLQVAAIRTKWERGYEDDR